MNTAKLLTVALSIGLLGFLSCGKQTEQTVVDIDGTVYKTVKIGNQVWMAKNLNVDHYRNGDPIPQVQDPEEWKNLKTGAWCYYKNDPANGEIYGRLYNWYAVDDSRGLCPDGWHVPSHAEWTTLTTYLGGTSVAGGKMKSNSDLWLSPNASATNISNFSGLPGGYRKDNGPFNDIGSDGFWWSSTELSSDLAWGRYLFYGNGYVYVDYYDRNYGFSVRCLRDN